MKRMLFAAAGFLAVAASYVAVLIALGSEPTLDTSTVASIALPALVAGLVMTGYIAWDARSRTITRGEVSQLSAQLVRKEIELDRLSSIDELTGLNTRHYFDEHVRLEFQRAVRHQRPLSLVVLEVDDLAELGDNLGRLSKGYLLSEVGAILRTMLRANDVGCRYANDTLAVLLPETNGAGVSLVTERIRALVAEQQFLGRQSGDPVRLTVSQGAAVAPSADFTSHADFVRAAEAALLDARTTGYNQVRMYASTPAAVDQERKAG